MPLINLIKSIWKSRKQQAAILLVLFVILYKPPIVETIGNLFRETFYGIKGIQSFHLNLKTPHAGEHVLPSAVQEMLALLRAHQLTSYQLSDQFLKPENCEIYQRIIESSWPKKIDPESHHKFVLIAELNIVSNCVLREQKKEVALVFCP